MNKQVKIILFSCFYMLGIITFFSEHILLFSLALFSTVFILNYKNQISTRFSIILCFIFILGILNSNFHIKFFDDLSSYTDNNVIITAKVITIPTNADKDKTKFYAKVNSLETNNTKLENINAKTLVTIYDSKDKFQNIKLGDTLKLNGNLKQPNYAKNPSQFDYARYLQFKNTFSLLYVNGNWEILSGAQDVSGKILRKLNDTRNKILKVHAENIKSPMLEILGGIIFGDDAISPDNDTKKSFINSGIFHILAASGMNVTLIFGIWFFFAKNLRLNYKFSIVSGILLILFYTCMTGFGPPIIRAALMLNLILIGKLIDRKTPTMSLLFLVAFIMLAYSPLMIFDIGFQLSFIVTFALIFTSSLLTFNFKFKPLNYTLGCILIPIIAQLFASPLQLYYFNTFTIYSVLANIAIIPVLSIVSFVGFISSILAIIPIFTQKICYFADILLNPMLIYIVKIAELFSSLPFSIIYLKKPAIIQIVLYFTVIIFIIYILKSNIKKDNNIKTLSKKFYYIISILIVIFAFTFIPIKNNKPEIIFFSVDNADAILIKSPKEKYFIIDSGKIPYKSGSSQAQNIIIKFLKDKGIKSIDSFILTHFDADHAGGTIDLLENLHINRIFITNNYENTYLSSKIFNYLENTNIKPIFIEKETLIYKEENFEISLIKPSGDLIKNSNQKSLITNLKYFNQNSLFMGDGDITSFYYLPDKYKNNITILKAGHHGAKNSLNEEMIKNTKLVIISTGKNNYNHPDNKIIDLLQTNNKFFYRTDYHNAIKIVLNKDSIDSYCFSPKNKKFIKNSNIH